MTDEQLILVEMVKRWRVDNHDLRFAQWIFALCGSRDPFHVEDDEMARLMTEWFEMDSSSAEVDGNPQGVGLRGTGMNVVSDIKEEE